jgi:hypothetical protein
MKDGKFESWSERQDWKRFAEAALAGTICDVPALSTLRRVEGDMTLEQARELGKAIENAIPDLRARHASATADFQLAELKKRSADHVPLDQVLAACIQEARGELQQTQSRIDFLESQETRRDVISALLRVHAVLDRAEADLARAQGDPEGRIFR